MDKMEEAREHFFQDIRQMENNAVLLREVGNGRLEPIYVSEGMAALMESTPEELMGMISEEGLCASTHHDYQMFERRMLKNHVADDGGKVLTLRKVTKKGNDFWCDVHYAFIEDYGERYVYCTYMEVSRYKAYEDHVRSVYASMGNSYYQENERTIDNFRVNLTKDCFEAVKGRSTFLNKSKDLPYSVAMRVRGEHIMIEEERKEFFKKFEREAMINGYAKGQTRIETVAFIDREAASACYIQVEALITEHPLTGDVVAFMRETECNGDKVKGTLNSKILAQQFDMVAYLTDGKYGVTIGDAANIRHGSIFPTSREGDYAKYLKEQVLPVLIGSEEDKARVMNELSLETIAREVRKQEPYEVTIAIEKEGGVFYKQFNFYMINPEADFYILLKSDTTEVQQQQQTWNEQLRMALEAANQANLAKTAFLSSMSHEIRTPMNAIIGLDNIALSEPDLPDSTREHLEKIGGSARHLLALINDILDMSRIESGRMTIRKEEFSFAEMLEQINTMMESQCQDRGLTYQCHLRGRIGEYYIGDDMRLKQVIINILGNAVKFTPEGGSVTFTVENVSEFEGQTGFKFVMSDTGIGMESAFLPRIFDAFSQEDGSRTNKYGSTGLGMAITKNIVALMNGDINVESEKGKGTTFTVSLTLKNGADRGGSQRHVNPNELRALVVDDDPVDLEHAKIVLGESGIPADVCKSGEEALEMIRLKAARKEDYNLMFIDWKMPGEDGVEITRKIRQLVAKNSAVIVLTAYNWEEIEDEAMKAGVDAFLAKPLFASTVLGSYERIMAEHRRQKVEFDISNLKGKRILVAEDMVINAQIMQRMLKMKGMESVIAENGQIAVDTFAGSEEGMFAAILMDVRMPVMDGLEATMEIRKLDHPQAKTIPIIAMTANAFDEDVQKSLQAGMNAHLSKPVETDKMYRTLAELINNC